jgi:uncharacterized membrane protein
MVWCWRTPGLKRAVRKYGPLLVVVALGTALRIHRIGREGLWIDEAFSVWLARRPWGEMVRWVVRVDQHPPLYYTLLHGWIRVFGDGEGSTRLLSALLSATTLPVIYALGQRLVDERVGLVSALILATSPFHVRFAQEARMYALLTMSGSLALWAAMRLLSGGRGVASGVDGEGTASGGAGWVGYVVFTATMLWTHNAAILFPIALNLFVLVRSLIPGLFRCCGPYRKLPRAAWRRWLLAQIGVLLLWLPWLPVFVSQTLDVYRRFWLPEATLGTVLGVVAAFLCDWRSLPLEATVLLDAVLLGVSSLGLVWLSRRRGPGELLAVLFVAPMLGEWVLSQWRPILCARTLIWTSVPLYLLLATGLRGIEEILSSRAAFLSALAIVLAANGGALTDQYRAEEKEAWDDAAALVARHVEADDLLLFNGAWGQIPFDYYFRQLYNGPAVEHGLPVDLFERDILEPRMTEEDLPYVQSLIGDRARVWLVHSHEWYTDPQGLVPEAFEGAYGVLGRWEFRGLGVVLYGLEEDQSHD